jgi:hypothetical protein
MAMSTEETAFANMSVEEPAGDVKQLLKQLISELLRQSGDDQLLRAIVSDNRKAAQSTGTGTAPVQVLGAGKVQGGNDGARWGWAETPPLRQPDGIGLIDEIAAEFDRRDRKRGLL